MSEDKSFTVELEHLEGYEFNVRFDAAELADMRVDEALPLGKLAGPNPSRMLAVAAANCLSASLLFCLNRDDVPAGALKTKVTCSLTRNDRKRLRVGHLGVRIELSEEQSQAKKLGRCKELFEDFCVVTASIREGIDVDVEVANSEGEIIHTS